jgi:hypothetical protein
VASIRRHIRQARPRLAVRRAPSLRRLDGDPAFTPVAPTPRHSAVSRRSAFPGPKRKPPTGPASFLRQPELRERSFAARRFEGPRTTASGRDEASSTAALAGHARAQQPAAAWPSRTRRRDRDRVSRTDRSVSREAHNDSEYPPW